MTKNLSVHEVLAIHQEQIRLFGGSDGVRESGLLEAAVARPQSGYYEDLIQEAAALWESLSQNHPFIDGNKRTAFVSAVSFLRINGLQFVAPVLTTIIWLDERYQTGTMNFAEIEAWLRANTTPL